MNHFRSAVPSMGSSRAVAAGRIARAMAGLFGSALLLVTTPTPAGQQSATVDEATITLTQGPGHDLVTSRCAICHSLDYVQMNSPVMTNARWQATVRKMIDKYGAPISDDEAKSIIEYLSANYVESK